MKQINKFLVRLAFVGLSVSAVQAQNTYKIFSGTPGAYFIGIDSGTYGVFYPLQEAIDFIRDDADGADCIIQFGYNNYPILNMDGGSNTLIKFEGNWGKITLTGKATTTCNADDGVIIIESGVSVECKAEITATADVSWLFLNEGTLTISGGEISATGDVGIAILNHGILNISGGEISVNVNVGSAVATVLGTVTINGGTISASGHTVDDCFAVLCYFGTLTINDGTISATILDLLPSGGGVPSSAVCNAAGTLAINGGTISASGNTVDNCFAVFSISGSTTIGGGTISANGNTVDNCIAVASRSGNTIINGGTISASGSGIRELCYAVYSEKGILTINDGTISASGDAVYHNAAVLISDSTTCNISGGTILATNATTWAILNISLGTSISGGTIENTSNYGNTIFTEEAIVISGGVVKSKGGDAVVNASTKTIDIKGNANVLSQEGYAIVNDSGTVNIGQNGIIFAYGTKDKDVIQGNYTRLNNAVIAAWDNTSVTTTYTMGTSEDIIKNPAAATVVWAKDGSDNGISVKYGATEGFIPIAGITVIGDVGVNELQVTSNELRVFPNPTDGKLRVTSNELRENTLIEIYDVVGKCHLSLVTCNGIIDISHLANGLYFLKVEGKVYKVVKQ